MIWQVIKMTIYLDVVLLENLIMNSIIVYVTAIITKAKILLDLEKILAVKKQIVLQKN